MSNITVPEFNPDQLALIKSTVAKGATDDELKLFLYRCKNMGLDPLKPGQVHFVKYGNNPGSVIVGIDGIRARAAKTGKISGVKRGVLKDKDGKLIGGWCEVYRSDWQHPAREEVSLSEYDTKKAQWLSKPETMIKKVAEAAALRMAFPDDLGGIYSEEEGVGDESIRDVKARELTATVQESEAAPEFEDAPYFESNETVARPPSIGDYVPKAGRHKGTALKQIPLNQLSNFISWYDNETANDPNKKFHQDVVEYYEKVHEFLQEAMIAEAGAPDGQ